MEAIQRHQLLYLSYRNRGRLVKLISYLFILLFLYAAVNKLIDFEKFKVQLEQSPILTNSATKIAWSIPIIEITLAIFLAFKHLLLPALYASFSLMLMFTVYIVVILTLTERIPCSCGGILEKMGWTEHLIFNIVFVILAVIGILLQSSLQEKKTM